MAYLERLSLDTLKIDVSFINTMDLRGANSNGPTIVRAIAALSKSLGLIVVAEGENKSHRAMGISAARGVRSVPGVSLQPPATGRSKSSFLLQKTVDRSGHADGAIGLTVRRRGKSLPQSCFS